MANKQIDKDNEKLENKYFFLDEIINSMKMSKGIYRGKGHLIISIATLEMLFDKLQLAQFLNRNEVTVEDYKKYFEQSATESGISDYVYNKLFKECQNER
jgi:hypothetical protein